MEQPTCATCRFWTGRDVPDGQCLCSTPSIDEDGLAVWPYVLGKRWCGEHKPIGDAPASPGLRWLWENGRKPEVYGVGFAWYAAGNTFHQSNALLPSGVFEELSTSMKAEQSWLWFPNEDTAMLAAARAVESSQYLAMEANRKGQP